MNVNIAVTSITQNPSSLNLLHYGHLIQHCINHNLFNLARQLHTRLILHSISPSNFLSSKLITLYSSKNQLHIARYILDQIPEKNLFSCNAMLMSYAIHSHNPSHSLEFFKSFPIYIKPDAFTLSALLKSALNIVSYKKIHGYAIRNRLLDNGLFVENGLLNGYAKNGSLTYARNLFDRMSVKDVVSWNSLISGYSQSGYYDECMNLYLEMEEESLHGVKIDKVTILSVLHACLQTKDLVNGMKVHQFAVENGVEMDNMVWNSIIGLYAKCGSLDYAKKLFDEMPEKDEVSYNAIISGYMMYGFVDRAMEIFNQMSTWVISTWNSIIAGLVQNNRHCQVFDLIRNMQDLGFHPNPVTLSSALPSISFYLNLLLGKQVHCYAIRNGYDQNIYVATALIDIYAKAGYLHGARHIFWNTKARSLILWTAIISAYSSHGETKNAIDLFNKMIDSGVSPDDVTFTCVLSACAHGGVIKEAREIFNMMMNYDIDASVEHYACMVGGLSRNGMLKEAVKYIGEMPVEPNAKVWGALFNGVAIYGDVETGKLVFEKLVEIEPENTGNYIIMANLFSREKKWEDAKMVRGKMSENGLMKLPGCSWIEVGNRCHVFVAKDKSNESSSEIYKILNGLVALMKDEGYIYMEELDEESFQERLMEV